jgi:ketosteroid isomerase-like protein
MKTNMVVCVVLAGISLCACTQSKVDVAAEQAALRAAADTYHEAGENMDADAFAGSYASNGLILPPNEAAVTGRDGAFGFISAFADAPGASVSFSNMNAMVAASGDMGYTLADAVVVVDGPDGQPIEEKKTGNGRYPSISGMLKGLRRALRWLLPIRLRMRSVQDGLEWQKERQWSIGKETCYRKAPTVIRVCRRHQCSPEPRPCAWMANG